MNWIFKNKHLPSKILLGRVSAQNKIVLQGKQTKGLLLALFFVSIFFFKSPVFFAPKVALAECSAATCVAPNVCNASGACVAPSSTTPLAGPNIPPPSKDGQSEINNNFVTKAFKWMLYMTLRGVGWIFGIVGTLFQWAVDPANISGDGGLLNKQAVKDVWIMVRDTLNMTFILILLFSAFCTVFQVDKWSLKKVWVNILINALLVNFSFPIARIFIDVSNVAMYYFLNHLFSGAGQGNGTAIMASFGDASNLAGVLLPGDYAKADIAYLLTAIVFTFILGITLLVLAALFVVRLIALTLIVMFSPIGFVGYIFPGTAKFAGQWWENLFKYSFFGPIMVFMMMVSLQIMRAMGSENLKSFAKAARDNAETGQANWIASASFYLIPVFILWIAMGISQKMGIEFADKIVGQGKKFANWVGDMPMRGVKYGWKQSGIPGGVKKGLENARKSGKILGFNNRLTRLAFKDNREERENLITGGIGNRADGVNAARRNMHTKKVAEEEKEMEELRTSNSELKQMLDPANRGAHSNAELEAAARVLSKREAFSNTGELLNALDAMGAVHAGDPIAAQERKNELIKKADKDLFGNANNLVDTINHLGGDMKNINQLLGKVEGRAFDGMDVAQYGSLSSNAGVKAVLDGKLKKEGKAHILVNARQAANPTMMVQAVVDDVLAGIKTEDIAKQDMFKTSHGSTAQRDAARNYVDSHDTGGSRQNIPKYQKINADLP